MNDALLCEYQSARCSDNGNEDDAPNSSDTVAPGHQQCGNCGEPFEPRKGTGGKPQRFCSPECRKAANANVNVHGSNVANVGKDVGQHPFDIGAGLSVSSRREWPPFPRMREAVPFDWAASTDAVVLQEQLRTAMYWNQDGDLVIRQECRPEDDHYVTISRTNIEEFLDRLVDACGIPSIP